MSYLLKPEHRFLLKYTLPPPLKQIVIDLLLSRGVAGLFEYIDEIRDYIHTSGLHQDLGIIGYSSDDEDMLAVLKNLQREVDKYTSNELRELMFCFVYSHP